MDEVMAEGIDWNQITDSLGFPMGNLSVPIPVPEPMMDMRGGIPEPMQPWDSFATPLDFGAAPLPDLTPVPVAMPDLPGPSNYTPAMDVHQSNAAASSSAMPQFNWWVPTPLGQPGHSVLSANMTEEQPPEEQTGMSVAMLLLMIALTLVNNPGMRAPGLDGLNPTITDNAPLLLDVGPYMNELTAVLCKLVLQDHIGHWTSRRPPAASSPSRFILAARHARACRLVCRTLVCARRAVCQYRQDQHRIHRAPTADVRAVEYRSA